MISSENKSEFNNDIIIKFEKYMEIMKYTDIGTFEWNRKEGIIFSKDIEERFNIKNSFLEQFDVNEFVFKEDIENFDNFIKKIKVGNIFSQITCRFKDCKDNYIWCKVSIICDFGKGNNIERFFGIIQIIDKEIKLFNELKRKIEIDDVTGIRNFEKFSIDTKKAFEQNLNDKFAIIVIDIKNFKIINDIYGIQSGNDVLRQISIILQKTLSENMIFGRRYSDNFVVTVMYENESEIQQIISNMNKEINSSNFITKIEPTFGVYIVDDKSSDIEIMCDRANIAKKNYNFDYKKTYVVYDRDFRKQLLEENNIEKEMYDALDNKKFFMYLQPKYDIFNKNIVGAEALVRWKRNNNDFLLPDKFLPLFEKNGFIIKLDEYIWEEACRIIRKWIDFGYKPVPISVNVSRRQIFNPKFMDMILWLTEKYNISHNLIGLELPESVFINNSDEIYEVLKKAKEYGFTLEMDDFGEGYSSLKMLKNVNVDVIKIDKDFLDETVNKKGRIVVKHTITMAKELNLKVIAEGVESGEQIDFLKDAGCEFAQGFYFSQPLSIDEFEYKTFYKK